LEFEGRGSSPQTPNSSPIHAGTGLGLAGVIAASLFRVKYEGLTAEGIHRAKQLIATFRPGATGKKPTAGAPAPSATTPASPKPVPA
jgi:hypothetical protein